MPTPKAKPVSTGEAKALFAGLDRYPALVLAVSGGPDSTALMLLAARWRSGLKRKPKLVAVTIDHRLRAESKGDATAVKRQAKALGIEHRTLQWRGAKPATGLQKAARTVRYRLLAQAADNAGAGAILTAHTLDDQAETVLIRLSRGSGLTGLAAMQRVTPVPGQETVRLVRPLLDLPKARLVATLKAAKVAFADDPSNRDPRFTRARLRELMPKLAQEGLDARRLALLARRLKRADRAIDAAVARAEAELSRPEPARGAVAFDAAGYAALPAEIALRLVGRALAKAGDEGPVELGKLEELTAALEAAQNTGGARFRRSLAGAIVTLGGGQITVDRAPPRRSKRLTNPRSGQS
jgi:tRNA(Ile)-lysidine synthase